MKKIKKIFGIIILFLFLSSFIFNFINFSNQSKSIIKEPKTATNYLFRDKTYNFTLEDVYDDADPYKVYTDAYFQAEYYNTTTSNWELKKNEAVDSGVNNNEFQLGNPTNINMVKGTSDYADNMKVLDASLTAFNSLSVSGPFNKAPTQWTDFSWTKGSGGATGELETNNGNSARIDAGSSISGDTFLGYIVPDTADIIANWNEGSAVPHYNKLDEAKGDMDGDGLYIRESSAGVQDSWQMSTLTIPANSYVSRLDVYGYCQMQAGVYYYIYVTSNCFSQGQWNPTESTGAYAWKSFSKTGLNINQATLNGLTVTVTPYRIIAPTGYVSLETVYIDVYYKTTVYQFDYEITWSVDPSYFVKTFNYDYQTSSAIKCDLDIYNWAGAGSWVELRTATTTAWQTGSQTLTGTNYVSGSNQVRIRFQSSTSGTDFDMYLDQISFTYYTSPAELEFNILTPFDYYNKDLLSIHVECHQKVSPATTINFKIWNYDTSSYDSISSSSETSITKKEFNSITPNKYISGSGVKLYWDGINNGDNFVFSIDYLLIRICYKMNLWHEASFDLLGTWRYRFEIHGSLYYSSYVTFEVIGMANFEAISESDYITRWILQGAEITPLEDFTDDISGSNWDLSGVSERTMILSYIPTDDAYVSDYNPNNNYGSSQLLEITHHQTPVHQQFNSFLKYIYPYLDINYTSNSKLSFYVNIDSSGYVNVYLTSNFDESLIKWSNQPATGTYQTFFTGGSGRVVKEIGIPYYYYKLIPKDDGTNRQLSICSSEWAGYKPYLIHYLSKNYLGSGYMYMQTNTTETIALKSTDYGSHYTLNSGDYFEIDFQTNSDSQINLILLKDGVVQKTLTISPAGNTNFNRRIVQIPATEGLEFDQLKISSTFEDKDYVKVYDIKTKKYTLTGDYADFYLGSRRSKSTYLSPDIYNLRIFENEVLKVNVNITISGTGQTQYIYIPIKTVQCRITLFSLSGEYLQFEDYHIQLNRSLNGEYNTFWLVDTIFSADEETYCYIDVYDRFDTLINSFVKLISNYIDLNLEVYRFQIKSFLAKETTVDIDSIYFYSLLPEDSLYFMLAKDSYEIGFYDENTVYKQDTIYLDRNYVYQLDSSYFQVYFSLFNFDGLGLSKDLFRFYVNNERKDFGFNLLKYNLNNLKVLDYFNETLFNQNLYLNAFSEYNIYVQVYTLILYNNYSHSVKIEIERNSISIEQIISAQFSLSYRFLPNVNYTISIYHLNNTLINSQVVNLTSNNKIVSFGFFTAEVPIIPEPVNLNDFTIILAFVIVISIVSILSILLYLKWKLKAKEVPEDTRKRYKRKWKAGTFDNRLTGRG